MGLAAFASVGASGVGGVGGEDRPPKKVTLGHATASATNPYVQITVDIESIVGDAGHGHSGVNVGDIIPPIPSAGYEGKQLGHRSGDLAQRLQRSVGRVPGGS